MDDENGRIGTLIPTNYIWDDIDGADNPELQVRMYQYINQMAIGINDREIANYARIETITGQKWFPDLATDDQQDTRASVRKVIYYPTGLPNTNSVAIPHGIPMTPALRFTDIYGTANRPGVSFLTLPFASPVLANNISVEVVGPDIVITTGSNRSLYTFNYIVLEYLIS